MSVTARIISRLAFYVSMILLLAPVADGELDDPPYVVSIEYQLNGEILNDSNLLNQLQQKTVILSGEPRSAYKIDKSVKAIYSIGIFSQIQVLERTVSHITLNAETVDGVALTFRLTQKTLIRKIKCSLDEESIRKVLKSREQGEYDEQVARADQRRIREFYRDDGYFQAIVQFIPPTDVPQGGEIELFYEITKGKRALIQAIEPKEVRSKLTLKVGAPYRKSEVENALSRLKEVYREQGYLNIQIEYVPTYARVSNKVTLQFTVTKGKKIDVTFKPDNVNKKELRKEMSLFKQADYSPEILQRNELQLEQFYRQKGYYNPKVTHQIKSETDAEVNIEFQIYPGIAPRIAQIDFEGNREFDDATLLDLMKTKPRSRWSALGLGGLFSDGIFDPKLFRTDKRVLKLSYRQAGYPEARIDEVQEVKNNQLYLHIKIKEGKLLFGTNSTAVRDLDNGTVSMELRKAFEEHGLQLSENTNVATQKTDSSWLLTDVDNRDTYAVWKEEKKLNIYESKKLVINDVSIRGNQRLEKEALLSQLNARKGKPYSKDMVDRDEFRLKSLYNREGYIYANIEPKYNPTSGILTYHINERNKATFGEFHFYGRLGVKVGILEREFKHLKGKQFDPEKLEEAKFRLYTFGLFRSIETKTPDRFEEGKTVIDVNVHVDARKARSVSVSGGYSPSEGIRSAVGITHYNIFKRNIRVGGRVQLGTKGNLGEVTWIEPWIEPPLIGQMMGTFRFFRDNLVEHDNTHAIGGTANFAKRLGLRSNFAVQYKYQKLRQQLADSDNLTTVSSIGASFHQDHRDSFLDPRNGRLNELAVEYAGGFMRGQESFSKFTSDNRYYRRLPKIGFVRNIVFASALRLGYAKGLRSNRERAIASFERFWAGGSTTVRGYEERTLGPEKEMTAGSADKNSNERRGDVMFILNAELRIPIYKRVGAVLFVDTGNVWNNLSELNKNPPLLHSAIGIGIRITTPLGPARIDYGIPLVKGRTPQPYLGLGHAF